MKYVYIKTIITLSYAVSFVINGVVDQTKIGKLK